MPFLHREMPYLYPNKVLHDKLEAKKSEIASLIYHDIFDYPLTFAGLIKWSAGKSTEDLFKSPSKDNVQIKRKDNFYFLRDREGLIYKRLLREKISDKKLTIAQKAASSLSRIPTIKMIAVTGALAMRNAGEDADIDLMIVTQKNTLWATRLLTLLFLDFLGLPRRRYGERNQKDKLCLNIWLDESDLVWRKRNIFTAHEIAQTVPLVNKEKTYERFLNKNRWIADYWPNAVRIAHDTRIRGYKDIRRKNILICLVSKYLNILISSIFEPLARKIQYLYMKNKITREVVKPTRALFHPIDWGKYISKKLQRFQITT